MSKPPKLAGIQEALTALHEKLDQPYRATNAGMWACSELDEVCELFERMSLAGFQHLADQSICGLEKTCGPAAQRAACGAALPGFGPGALTVLGEPAPLGLNR